MLTEEHGNLLEAPADALVNTVNTAGIMGKGLALLDYLAAVDWASQGTAAHGEMLSRLGRVQAKLTAVSAGVLSAFTAQRGYEPDGHRSPRAWMVNRNKMSKRAAGAAVAWEKRLRRHGRIAAAMTAGDITESWARDITESWARDITCWTDKLPAAKRDADQGGPAATLLALAADAMSGPDGLAAYLRTRELGIPYAGKSLPLDVGMAKSVPGHLRRAVILCDDHWAWPGRCFL
jgi:hypothetical protein